MLSEKRKETTDYGQWITDARSSIPESGSKVSSRESVVPNPQGRFAPCAMLFAIAGLGTAFFNTLLCYDTTQPPQISPETQAINEWMIEFSFCSSICSLGDRSHD